MAEREPRRIAAAGDWHGNTTHAVDVIRMAATALAGEPQKYLLHTGDFGIWPGYPGLQYLLAVRRALAAAGMWLLFVDGNHEDFAQLAGWEEHGFHPDAWADRRWLRIMWLRRGYRWQWHGRTWVAAGGGVSLDRAGRTEGTDWWPAEEITAAQEQRIIADGHADVLVSHDCPAGVVHTFPPPPDWWALRDLARNDAHRERLQRIVDGVRPAHIIHGHLHRAYHRECDFGYGPVQVTGLDRDPPAGPRRSRGEGRGPSWALLDVTSMTWEVPDLAELARETDRQQAIRDMSVLGQEIGPDLPAVCTLHLRFLPCRAREGCVISEDPADVARVARWQRGDADGPDEHPAVEGLPHVQSA